VRAVENKTKPVVVYGALMKQYVAVRSSYAYAKTFKAKPTKKPKR
jgi:hypothetical protein